MKCKAKKYWSWNDPGYLKGIGFCKRRRKIKRKKAIETPNNSPKITIDQMAWVFEQLSLDTPLKSIAFDLDVHYTTLAKWVNRAEKEGFAAWGKYA